MTSRRTLPVIIVVFMLLAVMHVTAGTVYASGGSCAPLVIGEGFNADGVLEKGGTADYMDNEGSGSCFYADPDREGSLPADGIINTTSGGYFKLGNYSGNNFLRLELDKPGTLTLDDKSCMPCKSLSFLVTGCDYGGTVTATVHFEGSEITTTNSFEVPDWGDGGQNIVYQCGRYSEMEYEETGKFRLYERTIEIPAELQGDKVTSIDLNLTPVQDNRCKACIFAVTATPAEDTRSVLYDANGGNLIFSSGVDFAPAGGKVKLPDAERGEDGLDGWYDGDTKVGTAGDSYTVSDNVILRAKWKTIFIRVLLYEESTIPQKIYQNDDGTYDHPQREHYTFKGFSDAKDGELIDENALVPGNIYYAVWEEDPFVMISYSGLSEEPLKIYLTEDHFITGHKDLPKIGTQFSDKMVLEGYYSDTEFTKRVDMHSQIPEGLFGKTIYAKLGEPFIYVKGTAVIANNQADVFGDQSVAFDFDTMTFTLRNADLKLEEGGDDPGRAAIWINTNMPVTICLQGDNKISADNAGQYGIYHKGSNATLNIKGTGSLNISADTGIACANPGQLDVQSGPELEVTGEGQAIKEISLTDGTKALGIKIKKSVDASEYELWDGESKLDSADIKSILMPGKEISHVEAKAAACEEPGNIEYWIIKVNSETRYFRDVELSQEISSLDETIIPALRHDWGDWVVTKPATETEDGVETRTCNNDPAHTETRVIPKIEPAPGPSPAPAPGSNPNQKGKDGTPAGAGASAACVDKAIASSASDEGPKGTRYAPLKLKSTKQTKTSVKLTWTNAKGAKKYVIYGNACGKKNKMKKLATVTGKSGTIKKVAGKKLRKGKYYKFIIVALDKNNNVVSTSKVIHVATKGGKVGNHKSVTVRKSVVNKAKKLKKGKSLKLNAKAVKASRLSVKKHRAVSYESSNPKIATVSKKGVVKGKQKGVCYIYAYAQNGVSRIIKIVVN